MKYILLITTLLMVGCGGSSDDTAIEDSNPPLDIEIDQPYEHCSRGTFSEYSESEGGQYYSSSTVLRYNECVDQNNISVYVKNRQIVKGKWVNTAYTFADPEMLKLGHTDHVVLIGFNPYQGDVLSTLTILENEYNQEHDTSLQSSYWTLTIDQEELHHYTDYKWVCENGGCYGEAESHNTYHIGEPEYNEYLERHATLMKNGEELFQESLLFANEI